MPVSRRKVVAPKANKMMASMSMTMRLKIFIMP
jgi:hypothetical protein